MLARGPDSPFTCPARDHARTSSPDHVAARGGRVCCRLQGAACDPRVLRDLQSSGAIIAPFDETASITGTEPTLSAPNV